MTAIEPAQPDPQAGPARAPLVQPNPELTRAMVPSVRSMLPQIVVAGVFPVIGYAILRPHVSSDAIALAAVMVFPVAEIVTERFWRGRFEPIGLIALTGIALGLVGAVAMNGDALLLKVRDSVITGMFGVVCLVSLFSSRPAMFYLGRSFATGGDPEKTAEFDQRWELPGVPRSFRLATAVWGVGLVGEAVARTLLAVSIPTQVFLIVSLLVFWAVIGGLMWFTVAYTKASERRV
ncbi:MAG: VC0807 family protein, partial [Acidimicrobiales bacterium]